MTIELTLSQLVIMVMAVSSLSTCTGVVIMGVLAAGAQADERTDEAYEAETRRQRQDLGVWKTAPN